MKQFKDDDQEYGYTMESILRERGYPEEVIEQALARKRAKIVIPEEG